MMTIEEAQAHLGQLREELAEMRGYL